ncbi:MAG: hypothetical protein MJZ97_11920 [Bacteroidales bacterium]|nr:hypothetical protein [Bacteroidales bacterium]
MGIFRQEMKTKRGLQNVLVTPFGLTKSKHNGIINCDDGGRIVSGGGMKKQQF